jgi:hypothetical protein
MILGEDLLRDLLPVSESRRRVPLYIEIISAQNKQASSSSHDQADASANKAQTISRQ